jgi:hypothetical protein
LLPELTAVSTSDASSDVIAVVPLIA